MTGKTSTATLLDRYRLGGLELPNRVVMAPMTRVQAAAGGRATPSTAAYYAQRASAGLIVTDAVRANGGRIFAQIIYGGRVSHSDITGLQPTGPSPTAGSGWAPT